MDRAFLTGEVTCTDFTQVVRTHVTDVSMYMRSRKQGNQRACCLLCAQPKHMAVGQTMHGLHRRYLT